MQLKLYDHRFFVQLLLLCWLTGCIDKIPLDTEGMVDLLVIEGSINNQPGPYTITIKRSGDFSEDQLAIPDPVTGAQVRIVASTGESSAMSEIDPGIYQTDDLNFRGEIGKSYHMEATLADGKTYRSLAEELLPVPPIEQVNFGTIKQEVLGDNNVISEEDFIRFSVDTRIPDDGKRHYLKWNFTGEYVFSEIGDPSVPLKPVRRCYVPDNIDLNKIVIFSGGDGARKELTKELLVKDLDNKFLITYCFHLFQQSLTPGAYAFWEKVEALVNRSGSLFEVPPGRIDGNIINPDEPDEEVLGYFYATAVDDVRFFVQRRDIEDVVIFNNCNNADPELLALCLNCLLVTNSTLEKPPYWED
ncbi:DUF4249 domain-containing protein [Fulvivirgaceae bacterium BMA12]|uniref:DUF4249 domain-containing protein n=1 Tax=Agaribacillus aureus TaxID=3051825 RepID=A0ABT8LHE9_9BACT|nr:DUF4249 domain-containing protein [Fulvivirgaceae bacterium BMA12]